MFLEQFVMQVDRLGLNFEHNGKPSSFQERTAGHKGNQGVKTPTIKTLYQNCTTRSTTAATQKRNTYKKKAIRSWKLVKPREELRS